MSAEAGGNGPAAGALPDEVSLPDEPRPSAGENAQQLFFTIVLR